MRNLPSKYKSWRLMVTYVIVNRPNDSHHGCLGWVMLIQNKPHTPMHPMLYVIFLWYLSKRLILNYNYKVLCAVCVVLEESYAFWWRADYLRNTRLYPPWRSDGWKEERVANKSIAGHFSKTPLLEQRKCRG